jgi:hypothetical protein
MDNGFYVLALVVAGVFGLVMFIWFIAKLSAIEGHLKELVKQGKYRIDNRF